MLKFVVLLLVVALEQDLKNSVNDVKKDCEHCHNNNVPVHFDWNVDQIQWNFAVAGVDFGVVFSWESLVNNFCDEDKAKYPQSEKRGVEIVLNCCWVFQVNGKKISAKYEIRVKIIDDTTDKLGYIEPLGTDQICLL